ncbi:MAG: ABC transporter permease [Mycoplasmataceae bacterium]|nr:ABC transporter permease [Mycoplasmataceae bacterium]
MKNYNPYHWTTLFMFYPFIWISKKIPKFKNDLNPIFKIVHKLFINSHMSTFLAFFYPLIFVSILSNVASPNYMVMGVASLIPIIIGIQVMPIILITLKRSSILKRMGATNTKSGDLTLVFIIYFSIVAVVSTVFNIGVGIGIYSSKMDLGNIDWGQLVLAMFFGILIGISVGMMVSAVVKKVDIAILVGMLLTLPGAFLTSEFLPPTMVNDWGPVRYISFLFPQKIATTFVHAAVNGGGMFAFNDVTSKDFDGKESMEKTLHLLTKNNPSLAISLRKISPPDIEIVNKIELIMAWTLLPIELIAFNLVSIKFFKWGSRW